jgi:hypothetical protein
MMVKPGDLSGSRILYLSDLNRSRIVLWNLINLDSKLHAKKTQGIG